MILETRSLTIGYKRDSPLLSELDISLKPGELVCLMGPNGSGKTTLLRTLSGLLPSIAGDVLVDGKSLTLIGTSERAKIISLVLTDPVNTGAMSGLDVVEMGRYPHQGWFAASTPEDKSVSWKALQTVGAESFSERPLYELSDGQRQKILIARALAQDCPIMILDEPNSHLDLNNRVEIMNVLKASCRDQNKGVLMATHELDLALQMADRIWLISEEGKLVSGIPEDLVLEGVIDKAFTLKGFDLRTGRVEHLPEGNVSIHLAGHGYLFLWTKNALERNGAKLAEDAPIKVDIAEDDGVTTWRVKHQTATMTFQSIEALLNYLKDITIK